MNRSNLFVSLGLCGILVLVPLGCGPSTETILSNAQPVVEQISLALKKQYERNGRYPQKFSELVKQGLLTEVPELPSQRGASSKYRPIYEVNNSLGFYRLSFRYHILEGIGPGDTHWRVFVSDEPGGWNTTGSPDSMENLVADRIMVTYRKQHDRKSLDLFVTDVIGTADCNYLHRDRVVRWLAPRWRAVFVDASENLHRLKFPCRLHRRDACGKLVAIG